MRAPGKYRRLEPASAPNQTKVARHPTIHVVIVTLYVINLYACIAGGVNHLVLVRTRSESNRGAWILTYRILAGGSLTPHYWRLRYRFDDLRPSPLVRSGK